MTADSRPGKEPTLELRRSRFTPELVGEQHRKGAATCSVADSVSVAARRYPISPVANLASGPWDGACFSSFPRGSNVLSWRVPPGAKKGTSHGTYRKHLVDRHRRHLEVGGHRLYIRNKSADRWRDPSHRGDSGSSAQSRLLVELGWIFSRSARARLRPTRTATHHVSALGEFGHVMRARSPD